MNANGSSKRKAGSGRKTQKRTRTRRTIRVIPVERRWLSVEEAADVANLSRTKLYKHLDEIGAKKVGRRTIIDRERLDGWLSA
jgi:excisionase family DNA binding protein